MTGETVVIAGQARGSVGREAERVEQRSAAGIDDRHLKSGGTGGECDRDGVVKVDRPGVGGGDEAALGGVFGEYQPLRLDRDAEGLEHNGQSELGLWREGDFARGDLGGEAGEGIVGGGEIVDRRAPQRKPLQGRRGIFGGSVGGSDGGV
jgi:hypothetical protein